MGKRMGEQDGEATGTGAQVKRCAYVATVGNPGREILAHQIRDE
jgi:hypothetical protein